MTRFGLIILAFFVSVNLVQAAEYSEKNADAVYENITHEYTLKTDGSTIYEYSHKLRLLSSYAVNRAFGESFLIYNPDYQKLEVLRSVTTMRDGKQVQSPPNAFNEVLPRCAAQAAPYLGLREMVVTHTGLESGCLIDFSYKIDTKAGFMPGLQGKVLFGNRCPVRRVNVIVNIPDGEKLDFHLANSNAKPIISGGRYEWEFSNVHAAEVEAAQPALEEFMPVLYFSSASAEEVTIALFDGTENPSFDEPKLAFIDTLLTNEQKILALQEYVLNNVGQCRCNLAFLGYKRLHPSETFQRNVGSSLDRAALLSYLLNKYIKNAAAFPVLATESAACEDNPALLLQYNRPLVHLKAEGIERDLLLDPDHEQTAYFQKGLEELDFIHFGNGKVDTPDDAANLHCSFLIKMDTCGSLSSRAFIETNLPELTSVRTESVRNKLINHFSGGAFAIDSIAIKAFDPSSGSVSAEIALSATQKAEDIAGVRAIALPKFNAGITQEYFPVIKANRTTPYHFPQRCKIKYEYKIEVPEGMKQQSEPRIDNIEFDFARAENLNAYWKDKNTYEIIRIAEIKRKYIFPDNYGKLIKILSCIYDPEYETVYFE